MTLALSIPAFVCADVNVQASKQASKQSEVVDCWPPWGHYIDTYIDIYAYTHLQTCTHTHICSLAS